MKDLREGGKFDILIIGGGAMGSGVALEAASRGLKCAVVDANDFAAGASSRSTKMAQGGMGTFEKMLKLEGNPFDNFNTIKVFLNERNYFLEAAPFMNHQYEIVIPERSLLKTLFYFYPGIAIFHGFYLAFLAWTNFLSSVDGPRILTRG
jgi:glycerol-3-phosphate dehydrogenase